MSGGRWYAIEAYFDPKQEKVIDLGSPIVVKGNLDKLLIVQVPSDLSSTQAHRLMRQTQETLMAGGKGTSRPMVLMPDIVKLAKVRKLSKAEVDQIKAVQEHNKATAPKNGALH